MQYVQTPPNSVFNIHCFRSTGMYQVPGDAAWVVHHLKRPQGMGYLWRRLHDRAPHDANACLTVRVRVRVRARARARVRVRVRAVPAA